MLRITIPSTELWDEVRERFLVTKEQHLSLEHSLVSLSKWEAKWCIPFLDRKQNKTVEQIIDYIRCMTVTQNVDPEVYNFLTDKNIKEVQQYIEAPMSATVFYNEPSSGGKNRDVITSELIYYWMIALGIPFECQKWHLNRLLTLIRICNIKNSPPKKMSTSDIIARNAALNKARRAALHSKG